MVRSPGVQPGDGDWSPGTRSVPPVVPGPVHRAGASPPWWPVAADPRRPDPRGPRHRGPPDAGPGPPDAGPSTPAPAPPAAILL